MREFSTLSEVHSTLLYDSHFVTPICREHPGERESVSENPYLYPRRDEEVRGILMEWSRLLHTQNVFLYRRIQRKVTGCFPQICWTTSFEQPTPLVCDCRAGILIHGARIRYNEREMRKIFIYSLREFVELTRD